MVPQRLTFGKTLGKAFFMMFVSLEMELWLYFIITTAFTVPVIGVPL